MLKLGVLFLAALIVPVNTHGKTANSTLNVAFKEDIFSMDCYDTTDRRSVIIGRHIYDSLLYRDPRTGAYLPLLAKSYQYLDATSIAFELRQGVTFHNGAAFTADDVVYTFSKALDPENPIKGRRIVEWILSVEKKGPYQVLLKMKEPFPAALEYLSGSTPIYPHAYYAKVGPIGMGRHPIGTGPYKFKHAQPGRKFEFIKNTAYFKESPKGVPQIENLIVHIEPDISYQIAGLKAGRFDWIWKVPDDQLPLLRAQPEIRIKNEETMRIGYLQFDSANRTRQNAPVNNLMVRKAIAHAINRPQIIATYMPGNSKVMHGACFPSQFGCAQPATVYDYAPEKAKALLEKAGYPNGFQINFYAYRDRQLAQAIMQDLKKIGIRANLHYKKYDQCRDAVIHNQVVFCFMTWGSYSVNDVSAITSHFFKGNPDDLAQDQTLIHLLTEADNSIDPQERKKHYQQALDLIAQNVYWLPLWSYSYNYAYHKNLVFTPSTDEIPRFFNAYWQP